MKKISCWTFCVMAVLMSLSFTSCDRDVDEAMALSGQWRGDFGMYYFDRFGNRWDSYDTDIVFYPEYEYATHGYGKQVDYYDRGPYRNVYYYFNWNIRNGVIYLTYPRAHDLDAAIYDYRLNERYFSGWFGEGSERFKLYKLTGFYDWNCYTHYSYYDDYYGYDVFPNYYYAKTRGAENADSAAPADDVVMRRGNRFTDAQAE